MYSALLFESIPERAEVSMLSKVFLYSPSFALANFFTVSLLQLLTVVYSLISLFASLFRLLA